MDRQQLPIQPRDTRSGALQPGEGPSLDRPRPDRPQADLPQTDLPQIAGPAEPPAQAAERPAQGQPPAATAVLQPAAPTVPTVPTVPVAAVAAGSAVAAGAAVATEAAEANPDSNTGAGAASTATVDTAAAPLGFAQAIEITGQWLAAWEAGELSEEVLADRVAQLVASRDGARGFFVVALAGDSPLLDRLPEPLLLQLRRAGAPLIDLTARNLAMSSAMAVAHGRGGDRQQQAGSERVQARATELLRQLEPGGVRQRLETLLAAARDQQGEDVAFLERWGYDAEQRQGIAAAIEAVASAA